MRHFLALAVLAVFAAMPSHAESGGLKIPDAVYPQLATESPDVSGFVPAGWKIEAQQIGDLNGDRVADVLFLLREASPANVVANPGGLGEDPLDSNPRILAAAFREGEVFKLAMANHTLIPRHDDPVIEDTIGDSGGVEIKGRTVVVTLHLFASAGGWDAGNRVFRLRFQRGAFQLIGFDQTTINRASGEVTELSINFVTGDVVEGKGTIEQDETKKTRRKIPHRKLLTIDEVGNGFDFQPHM